jgi:hypothetical protein
VTLLARESPFESTGLLVRSTPRFVGPAANRLPAKNGHPDSGNMPQSRRDPHLAEMRTLGETAEGPGQTAAQRCVPISRFEYI